MPKASPQQDIVTVGCDDGFSNTDIVIIADGKVTKSIKIPSRARTGMLSVTQVAGGDGNELTPVYETDGVRFTVGVDDGESAGFEGYPLSAMNRVIIHHALRVAGLAGREVRLATGLPLGSYYNGDKPNESFIAQKKASLEKIVTCVDDSAMAKILSQDVFPEGLAAWLDHAVDLNGNFVADQDESVGFIDIGGRTTDIGVVKGNSIDFARCGSATFGLLNVTEEVGIALQKRFDMQFPGSLVEKALVTKQLKRFGKWEDISAEVDAAVNNVGNSILNEVNRKLGNGATLDKVLVVGGGAYVFDVVKNAFPHAVVPDQPEFANARGFAKFLMING